MNAEFFFDAKATLGEGPAWDEKTQTLYWVDILEKRMYAGTEILAQWDEFIGCLAPRKNGNLILGMRASFVDYDPATSQQTVLATVNESANNRMNDGKCDPAGRFIAGTMAMNETDPSGSLYSFDGKENRTLFSGVTISNGMTWSPNHKIFYYIDTPTRKVQAFDYDLHTGQVANPRTALHIPDSLGWPDGMTSDMNGNLWIAMWGGAQVTQWDPAAGRLINQIPLPVFQPSSCVFGGKDYNELYITSARIGMDDSQLKKYPLSGGIFKVVTNLTGMPTFEFGNHHAE